MCTWDRNDKKSIMGHILNPGKKTKAKGSEGIARSVSMKHCCVKLMAQSETVDKINTQTKINSWCSHRPSRQAHASLNRKGVSEIEFRFSPSSSAASKNASTT